VRKNDIDSVWEQAIAQIETRPYPPPAKRMLTSGEFSLIVLTVARYEMALALLVRRKWNPKHKLPVGLALASPMKPLAEVLRSISELCKEAHYCQEMLPHPIPYAHAAVWFREVYWELVGAAIIKAITPVAISDRRKKEGLLGGMLDELRALREFQNPISDADEMLATQILFGAAISLSEQSERFRKNYFNPLLKAVAADIKALSGEGWGVAYLVEDGRACVQAGKGRGVKIIPTPEPWEKYFSGSTVG
jgi:hypothetical protein